MIAGPPAFVRTATRSPAGNGHEFKALATANSSSIEPARSTPHWARKVDTVRLDHQDGFLATNSLGGFGEIARIAERLEIHADDAGLVIVLPVLEEIVTGDVGLVSDRGELGQADAESSRFVENRHTKGSRLADETDGSSTCRRRSERCIHRYTWIGIDDPHAIGSDHAYSSVPDLVSQLKLELGALRAGFGKTGGDHDKPLDTGGDALVHDGHDDTAGHDDDGEINRVRYGSDRRIGLERVNRCCLRVDGKDSALKLRDNQIVEQREAD
jgi:hypothetical protein